jgi:hypothetical protein
MKSSRVQAARRQAARASFSPPRWRRARGRGRQGGEGLSPARQPRHRRSLTARAPPSAGEVGAVEGKRGKEHGTSQSRVWSTERAAKAGNGWPKMAHATRQRNAQPMARASAGARRGEAAQGDAKAAGEGGVCLDLQWVGRPLQARALQIVAVSIHLFR